MRAAQAGFFEMGLTYLFLNDSVCQNVQLACN